MPPIIDRSICIRCGTCADICNSHLFSFTPDKGECPVVRYPDECWHCNSCVIDCPAGAITLRLPINFTLLRVDAVKPATSPAETPQEARA